MKRSALPLVRGLPGRIRRWRSPSSRIASLVVVGDVAGAVVAHHCSHLHASLGKPGERPVQEADRAAGGEVVEHLGVGKSGVIVDHHVHVLPARDPSPTPLLAGLLLRGTASRHPVSRAADPAERLDVDMHQLARVAPLVAVGWLRRLQPRALAKPDPFQPDRDGGKRQRKDLGDLGRRHPQTSQRLDHPTRSSESRLGLRLGRDERSSSSRSPRGSGASHLQAVRWLQPAASAASASVHPSSSTRRQINLRLLGQVR